MDKKLKRKEIRGKVSKGDKERVGIKGRRKEKEGERLTRQGEREGRTREECQIMERAAGARRNERNKRNV